MLLKKLKKNPQWALWYTFQGVPISSPSTSNSAAKYVIVVLHIDGKIYQTQ